MRELKGEKDLQLAKDVLCAFESKHHPNQQACSDIRESLYWFEAEDEYYSVDVGALLRGECEDVRIFEFSEEDEWFSFLDYLSGWSLAAFTMYQGKTYFFCI